MCRDVLGVDLSGSDVAKQFRLGRREEGRNRPLLVAFKEENKKSEVMKNLKKLKSADARYRRVSVAHDLSPRQREEMKTLLEEAKLKYADEEESENFRLLVVGQQTRMKVIRVKKQE